MNIQKILFFALALLLTGQAAAADKAISAYPAASAADGTEVLPVVQGGNTRKMTTAQIKTFTSASPTLITPVLGVATATSINGNAFTAGTYTLTGGAGKTLTFNNSLALSGTDSTTMTFPTTSATLARTDAANSFTGTQTLDTANVFRSAAAADGSTAFYNLTGTYNASPSSTMVGADMEFTTAGSSQATQGLKVGLIAGSTSTSSKYAGFFVNALAKATGTTIPGTPAGSTGAEYGAVGSVTNNSVSSGVGVGIAGSARASGTTGLAIGAEGAVSASSTNGIGVVGTSGGFGSTATIGVLGTLGTTTTANLVSGAVVAANEAVAAPMIVARDNSATVWEVADDGSIQGNMTLKALTESSATNFVKVTMTSGSRASGFVHYAIEADDGTDFQIRAGVIPFSAVDKAGTITCTVGTVTSATEVAAVSTGTLTNTFTCADATSNVLNLLANAVSSLTQTTLRIRYTVQILNVLTVAPQ